MSDLEKFKQLFDDIGIEYTTEKYGSGKTTLEVSEKVLFDGYGVELGIDFSADGKFIYFIPSGE